MSNAPAAFEATYSDWKLVKSRKVVQIVLEVPMEAADLAYQVLGGMPNHAAEAWLAVAKLDKTKTTETKERKRFDTLPAGQQAAMRCNEMAFWKFLEWKLDLPEQTVKDELTAANMVRAHFKIDSRTKLNAEPLASRWRDFNLDYQLWCRS